MPLITIRPLVASDWDAWWALRLNALREHPDAFGQDVNEAIATGEATNRARFVDGGIRDPNRIVGAFTGDGALVGVCGIVRHDRPKTRHRMDIWGMYVAPPARGSGVGRRLAEAAIEHARQSDDVLQIHLTVASHNESARALYSQLGFMPYGREPRSMRLPDRFVDEELMVLMLDAPTAE